MASNARGSEKVIITTNILVTGYYGLDNIGDEAVLAGLLNSLKNYIDDPNFFVITNDPAETKILHGVTPVSQSFKQGVAAFIKAQILKRELYRVYRSIDECDLFILGGGSLLHDLIRYNLPILLSLVYLAQKKGKTTVVYGIGAGPIDSEFGKFLCNKVLRNVDLLTVRDMKSRIALEICGLDDIIITADPAFAMRIPNRIMHRDSYTNKCFVSTTSYHKLCNAKYHYIYKNTQNNSLLNLRRKIMADIYDDIIDTYGKPLLFIPSVKSDIDGYRNIRLYMRNSKGSEIMEYNNDFNSILMSISSSDFLVGMRLHSLIFATMLGTPLIPIVYDEKVASYLDKINLYELSLNIDEIDSPRFKEHFMQSLSAIHERRSIYSKRLLTQSEIQRNDVLKNAELVSNLI